MKCNSSDGARAFSRGYALVLVMTVLALLSIGLLAMLNHLTSSALTSAAVIEHRRLFYGCDGTARGMVQVAKAYLRTDVPTAEGLGNAICAEGGGGCTVNADGDFVLEDDPVPLLRPPGFTVSSLSARSMLASCTVDDDCGDDGACFKRPEELKGRCRVVGGLPNGPFRGIPARQDTILLAVEQRRGEHRCRVQQTLTLGKLSMFQFFLFSDSPYTDWQPVPKAVVEGRVHANGDLCLGGGQGLYLETVTAAGDINPTVSNRCRLPPSQGAPLVFIANKDSPTFDQDGSPHSLDPRPSDFRQLLPNDRDRAPSWEVFARNSWSRHVLDRAHDVQTLKLPVLGKPTAQNGFAADGTVHDNADSLRFFVEPVRFRSGTEDEASVRAQKLAEKATIRIIDGVWYVRRNDNDWPGLPIWSDHPGHYVTSAADGLVPEGIAVGQDDILHGGPMPRLYSAYSGSPWHPVERPVITYGAVANVGSGMWQPSHVSSALANSPTQLLEATRRGFRSAHAQAALATRTPALSENARHTPANVLPINVDVGALQEALDSNRPNELGRVLRDLGVEFNGIVWIGASWPGSEGGYAGTQPATIMAQGEHDDPFQPMPPPGHQRALPRVFCSDSDAGTPFFTFPYMVPNCAFGSRPNAVRTLNARFVHVDHATNPFRSGPPQLRSEGTLPAGLTIATSLPLYAMGDHNLSANTEELDMGASGAQWVPMLLAGDVVTVLSNAWQDAAAPWHQRIQDTFFLRRATTTTLNVAIMGGWTMTRGGVYSGGVENLLRINESWQNQTLRLRGSLVISHNAVYDQWPRVAGGSFTTPPQRDWAFDKHLENLSLQPPGAPVYDVTAVRSWQRH